MSKEVRVLVHPGIEPKVAGRRVDVQLLVEGVQSEPVPVEFIDAFAPIDPGPASAVVQRAARVPEHGGDDPIGRVSGDRVPVGQRADEAVLFVVGVLLVRSGEREVRTSAAPPL